MRNDFNRAQKGPAKNRAFLALELNRAVTFSANDGRGLNQGENAPKDRLQFAD